MVLSVQEQARQALNKLRMETSYPIPHTPWKIWRRSSERIRPDTTSFSERNIVRSGSDWTRPECYLPIWMTIGGLEENLNRQLTIFQVRQWRWQPSVVCVRNREPFSVTELKENLIVFVCCGPISCSRNGTKLSQHAYCPLATSMKYARVKLRQWRNWSPFMEWVYSLLPYLYDLLGTVFLEGLQWYLPIRTEHVQALR